MTTIFNDFPCFRTLRGYCVLFATMQYIKLISDDDGSLRKDIFYDNIRDFQGLNEVNTEIKESLCDEQNDSFVLLNNGVTIVAGFVEPRGDNFLIEDYQVVNGCQTSHVVYQNQDNILDNIYLSVKLIETNDSGITNKIIRATNRQTELKNEAFASLQPFHKELEKFYRAYHGTQMQKLYYERRSKQYAHENIEGIHIVSFPTQLKCYLAMFLEEPHSHHRYYGELLDAYEGRLFREQHSPYQYFVSGYTYYLIEKLIRNETISPRMRPFRFHLMMLFRMLVGGVDVPPPTNKPKSQRYCKDLLDTLQDEQASIDTIKDSISIVESVQRRLFLDSDHAKRIKRFTSELKDTASITNYASVDPERTAGIIKFYNDDRGFGFIEHHDKPDIFFHIRDVSLDVIPAKGIKVNYKLTTNTRGLCAVDIEEI